MDQEKQMGFGLAGRSTNWNEFITFLTEDIFGSEICDLIRSHQPNLRAPGMDESLLAVQLEDWEWRLFDISDAVKNYLKDQGPFLPQAQVSSSARAASALNDLFWSEIKLRRPELWRADNIGIRVDESGSKVLVGFRNSGEGMSLGPFKFPGPYGSE
jgi:hypothetical protein